MWVEGPGRRAGTPHATPLPSAGRGCPLAVFWSGAAWTPSPCPAPGLSPHPHPHGQAGEGAGHVRPPVNPVCTQNDEDAMVEAVALYNPVSFAFEVTEDFLLYKKGIYSR